MFFTLYSSKWPIFSIFSLQNMHFFQYVLMLMTHFHSLQSSKNAFSSIHTHWNDTFLLFAFFKKWFEEHRFSQCEFVRFWFWFSQCELKNWSKMRNRWQNLRSVETFSIRIEKVGNWAKNLVSVATFGKISDFFNTYWENWKIGNYFWLFINSILFCRTCLMFVYKDLFLTEE